jgi:hypothetical protein
VVFTSLVFSEVSSIKTNRSNALRMKG